MKKLTEENVSQEFRLKNTDETRDYFIKEIKQNKLMSKKHKMTLYNFNLYWTPTWRRCIIK